MAVKTAKAHSRSAIEWDGAIALVFDNVASVGAAAANTTVQARLPLPFRCKIRGAAGNLSAIGSGGTHSYSVVKGTGTPGAAASQETLAAANATAIPATTLATGDTPVTAAPTEPDAIYAKGDLLTLRAVTPASTGSMTNLKVVLFVVPIDGQPESTNVRNF